MKLHKHQMEVPKNRCIVDTIAIIVDGIHKIQEEKKIAKTLLIDIKSAFDYVSRLKLAQQMRQLGVNNDLIRWTQFFLTDRKVEIVIDRHVNIEKDVKTRILQGLPVSLILFIIYISKVFNKSIDNIVLNDIYFLCG